MYRVKDKKYMAYVIGKHGIADFTLTDENDFPVFEENDNLSPVHSTTTESFFLRIRLRNIFLPYNFNNLIMLSIQQFLRLIILT